MGKPIFEAISERDIIKRAQDLRGAKGYIKRADLDTMADLTGCGRDDIIDWLCDNGVSLDRYACGHSNFRQHRKGKEEAAPKPETPPAENYKEPLLKITEEMLESMMEERERLKKEAEKAWATFEAYNDDCDAVAALAARLQKAESVTITEATT